jgi:Family of unknown function (DUF5681)
MMGTNHRIHLSSCDCANSMDEAEGEHKVGRGKPPLHTRFKKGQSGNPRGLRPRPKDLPALLVAALNEPIVLTANGETRQITKREAVVAQLVDKSTGGLCNRAMCRRARLRTRGRWARNRVGNRAGL